MEGETPRESEQDSKEGGFCVHNTRIMQTNLKKVTLYCALEQRWRWTQGVGADSWISEGVGFKNKKH